MTSLLAHVRFRGRPQPASADRPCARSDAPLPSAERPRPPFELDAPAHQLVHAILAHAGLHLTALREAPLARRIPAVLRALRAKDAADALVQVEQSVVAHERALSALLIGHTVAFRDEHVFEVLRRSIVPQLPARPRVWSMGCSRGLELLSIALLLAERGHVSARLRGSDLRSLDPAADPALPRDLLAQLPAALADLQPLATPEWIGAQVRAIDWRRENVIDGQPDGSWDLILCRNLAIYLQPDAAARLWQRIASSLAPGGLLVVGKAERPLGGSLHRCGPCIYRLADSPATGRIA